LSHGQHFFTTYSSGKELGPGFECMWGTLQAGHITCNKSVKDQHFPLKGS